MTEPVVKPIVAILVALLLQVPPVLPSARTVVDPEQTVTAPDIADGTGFIVTVIPLAHPNNDVYVIVSAPAAMPETVPEPSNTVATPVLLLLHVPPVVPSLSETDEPAHTTVAPAIADGSGSTEMIFETVHPIPIEYVMVDGPDITPDMTPDAEPAVATAVALLLHVPPVAASVNVMVDPIHTADSPRIDGGNDVTVTTVVTAQPVAGSV